jgi:AAA15 family ATPase/GTPase
MKIIEKIEISGYKPLEKLEFPSKSINIIVGRNNIGKSSILESIWLCLASLNDYRDLLGYEMPRILYSDEKIRYLIKRGKSEAKIKIKLSRIYNNEEIELILELVKSGCPKELKDYFQDLYEEYKEEMETKPYEFGRKMREISSRISMYRRRIENLEEMKDQESLDDEKNEEALNRLERMKSDLAMLRDEKNELLESELSEKLINAGKIFMISKIEDNIKNLKVFPFKMHSKTLSLHQKDLTNNMPKVLASRQLDIDELYEKLEGQKAFWETLEIVRNKIKYLEDIRKIKEDLYVYLNDISDFLPLSTMGDGFIALVKISFMVALVKRGVLLFEEPETTMHPGYMNLFCEEIIKNSKNAQFFITTHSLELLDYLLEKAKEKNSLDNVLVLRLQRTKHGEIEREYLSGSEAQEEREAIRTDLRGY